MERKPPANVKRSLRQEVGFGCPINGCGNPYLEYHHFDPPFSFEQHHRVEGMIALCAEHHKKADGGAYTKEQQRDLKRNQKQSNEVRGRFDWMRNRLLAVVGGNFYYETLRILTLDGEDVVWFNRDADGYLLLNVRMRSLLPRERAIIIDNDWENIGEPVDLESPPHGKELTIRYDNGDFLSVEFMELETAEVAFGKYKCKALLEPDAIEYPITAVEVNMKAGGTNLKLSSSGMTIGGMSGVGNFASRCGEGFILSTGIRWQENPSKRRVQPVSRLAPCPCGSGLWFKRCHGAFKDG